MRLVPSRSTRRITPLKLMLLLAMFFAPEFAAAGSPRDPELTLPASHWETVAGAGASAGGWWLMAGKDERENKRRRLNQTVNGDMRKMFRPVDPSSAGGSTRPSTATCGRFPARRPVLRRAPDVHVGCRRCVSGRRREQG